MAGTKVNKASTTKCASRKGGNSRVNAAIDTYGHSERNKYRAVVYYLLVKHFGKESVYS